MAEAGQAGFGPPGGRLRPSAFLVGLTAAAGGPVAVGGVALLHRAATVAVMLVLAGFLAVGLGLPLTAIVRRGMRRIVAVALLGVAGLENWVIYPRPRSRAVVGGALFGVLGVMIVV